MSARRPRVVAVVVAWNRRVLLLEALDALAAQTRPLDAIVVVDNGSTDGTSAAVRSSWPQVDLFELERNTGGAGGFVAGMAKAVVDHDADLIWLMDDDTIAEPDALGELVATMGRDDVVLAGSRVVWTDGRPHGMNTPRAKSFASAAERRAAVREGSVPVRSSSFVSMLVRRERVVEYGLPIADYFIWNDDFEFSTRMLRAARGVVNPRSVVVHKTTAPGATDADPRDRFYFEVRNKLWLFLHSKGLAPGEKLVYLASTLLRWARTFRASGDRRVLRRALWRGVRAGLFQKPRPNQVVLRGIVSARLLAPFDGASR